MNILQIHIFLNYVIKNYEVEAEQNSFRETKNYKEGYLEVEAGKPSAGVSGGVLAGVTILMTGKFN